MNAFLTTYADWVLRDLGLLTLVFFVSGMVCLVLSLDIDFTKRDGNTPHPALIFLRLFMGMAALVCLLPLSSAVVLATVLPA